MSPPRKSSCRSLPSLEVLNVGWTSMTDNSIQILATMIQLKELTLSNRMVDWVAVGSGDNGSVSSTLVGVTGASGFP